MKTPTPQERAFGWLDKRFDLSGVVEFIKHKEVPVGLHSMFWYYLGGTTLFFFSVQILSGILLLMYYQPGESTSYESIRFITTKVPFGWLVRSAHCWSAHLMTVSLITHMFSTLFLKAYRPPRELTWVTGFVLFSLTLGFGFSGYLLPWNELSFFATAVGTDSVKGVPVVGEWLLQVMRGGPDVSINTLYRFFALHVVILPLLMVGVIGGHLLFVQRQGMALPVGHTKAPRGMRFFPNFALRDAVFWLVCLTLLATLAVMLPYGPGIPGVEWELGLKANPLAPAYPGIKPEWYFLWIYQLLKEFPPHLFGLEGPQAALVLISGLMGGWALIPWLDRRAQREEPSPGFADFGVAAVIFLSYLTLMAWDIGGEPATHKGLPDPALVAKATSWWVLGLAATITALRAFMFHHRWFFLTGAAVLQVVLHGPLGMGYLLAGLISVVVAAVAVAAFGRRKGPATTAGHQGGAP